ncbi:LamG-like jellyroll fold domain-containing protein [uncultured Cellulomonas sp.]|uniref:LamG-like jellyroll fold domain-containing protein n=1 Tax=uncultured Cellulomonas sp. TaxID=189682 RepID=UPI00261E1E51|nr:LamG-like jellyroll fold domain-containing protein [uncultured Cellulomonas sp.]
MALGALCALVAPVAASADTAPSDPALPATVAADALPTVQIDGVVWDQEIVGNRVYAVGNFTTARPAGAAPGTQTVTRTHMLAYDLTTGALITSFAPYFNAQVRSVSVSPDGRRVYVGGEFTQVRRSQSTADPLVTRERVAAFDAVTGELLAFAPRVNARVAVVEATNDTLYVGGIFSAVGPVARVRVAALNTTVTAGTPRPFTATPGDGQVNAMALSPTGASIVIGGSFTTVNGTGAPGYGLAKLRTSDGAPEALPVNSLVRNGGPNSSIYNLYGDATGFYGVGYVFGSGGNLEGAFSADWDGTLRWLEDCHGDSYDIYTSGPATYTVGHPHFCSTLGGYPQTEPWTSYNTNTFTNFETRKLGRNPYSGYFNFQGQPGPSLLNFFPTFTAGAATGASQATWTVTGNGRYVVYGGEFTKVNGTGQQGLVRMAVDTVAPNAQGPRVSGAAFNPRLQATSSGSVRVVWPGNWDRDNRTLVYRLYRDGNTSVPVFERTVTAAFWEVPQQTFTDTGHAPGSTHTYRITATDPKGNVARSQWVPVTTPAAGSGQPYLARVLDDGATSVWRLGEAAGTVVSDSAGFLDGQAGAGVTRGQPGAVVNDTDTASTFSGTSTGTTSTQTSVQGPDTFTLEAWVSTTTASGGKIIGLGNRSTGLSTGYDRNLYMDNLGRIFFGANQGGARTVNSPLRYNDGGWHHVVGTVGPTGMTLYVDGSPVAQRADTTGGQWLNGFWRIGGDNLNGWPSRPSSSYFRGQIDEVAVYPTALSAAQVLDHYTVATSRTAPNQAPVASFATQAADLTLAVDGSASFDPDGAVARSVWDFGDGTGATGATASHTYAAAGTYTVRLTVTDGQGATGTTTRSVTVTAPPAGGELVIDDFERSLTAGWGTASRGGPWTASPGSAVVGGQGSHVLGKPGVLMTSYLGQVSSTSADVQLTVGADKDAGAGTQILSVVGRRVGTAEYRARVRLGAGGAVSLQVERDATALQAVSAGTYAPGERLRVRLQVTGTSPTTLRAKVWKATAAEPAGWQVSATDATAALQAGGSVGVTSYLSGSATNAPVAVTWDDLRVTPAD